MGIRELFEDALRIKIIPNDNKYAGVPITDDDKDLANRQIKSAESGSLIDLEAISKFRTLSADRQERYAQFEDMLKDATIAAAIEMYADDSTQYDYRTGRVIWAESDDADIAKACNRLIDVLGINEKAWSHIYALCAYGDVYLRLYRKGDQSDYAQMFETQANQTTLRVKKDDNSRPIEEYIEYVDDPATMYDLQERDKTSGFIRMIQTNDPDKQNSYTSLVSKTFNVGDVNLYDRKSFVHICLAGNITRNPELIALNDGKSTTVYKVKTGKSILADAYEPSQTVKLLEDSLMLNRVTKSALVRILQIEVGNMPKSEMEALLRRIKGMIEQKMAYNATSGYVSSYNSPGPVENIIYVPTKEGKGTITTTNLGGDVNVRDIVDVDYFNNKKLSALKIPKQYLNYDAPEGLGNGTSLTKLSSRYAHTIMRIQNAYISGITTLLNLYFLDKGLDYINDFTLKMVSPSTIEDTERDEQITNRLTQARDILDMISEKTDDAGIFDTVLWILENFLNLTDIADILRDHSIQHDDTPSFDVESGGRGGAPDFGGPSIGGMSDMGGAPDFGDMSDLGGSEEMAEPTEEPSITPEA